MQYANTQGELQPLEAQVIIQNALGNTRMQVGGGRLTRLNWYEQISEKTRAELRQEGLKTLESIRKYLAAGAPDEQLSAAITAGKDYAAMLNRDGLSLADAVRGFFYFSDFVINSVLTWSELTPPRNNTSDWGTLLRQVNTFINTILLSIIEYYESE